MSLSKMASAFPAKTPAAAAIGRPQANGSSKGDSSFDTAGTPPPMQYPAYPFTSQQQHQMVGLERVLDIFNQHAQSSRKDFMELSASALKDLMEHSTSANKVLMEHSTSANKDLMVHSTSAFKDLMEHMNMTQREFYAFERRRLECRLEEAKITAQARVDEQKFTLDIVEMVVQAFQKTPTHHSGRSTANHAQPTAGALDCIDLEEQDDVKATPPTKKQRTTSSRKKYGIRSETK